MIFDDRLNDLLAGIGSLANKFLSNSFWIVVNPCENKEEFAIYSVLPSIMFNQ
jgi:hypothetical protein